MRRVVIVGASIGGVRAAQSLRSGGYSGEIVVVSEEQEAPYDRPPLSKAVLAGTATDSDIRLIPDATEAGMTFLSGRRATGLDVRRKVLSLDGVDELSYGALVVATGCSPKVPTWARVAGVHVLRTLSDALALRDSLARGRRVAIVGAGFIGCEVAAVARARGLDVWLIDPLGHPMARALDQVTGEWFARIHEDQGVHVMLRSAVSELTGGPGAFRLSLDAGEKLEVDTVLVGVGAEPNVGWLASSGLTVDDGVRCDEYGRALGARDVYAVGDAARWHSPALATSVRHEHWTNAVDQANCVAHNIMNPAEPHTNEAAPYVWTDQYHWKAQMVGFSRDGDRTVLGNPFDDGRAAALYCNENGALTGAVIVNWPRALVACRRAVHAGEPLDQVAATLQRQRVGSPV